MMSTWQKYHPPGTVYRASLFNLLPSSRKLDLGRQERLIVKAYQIDNSENEKEVTVYVVGDYKLLKKRCVAVVGSRDVSEQGEKLAKAIAAGLVDRGVVVVSGLAKGVDSVAHKAAIEARGSTIAVIGTPLNKAYPRENSALQEEIYKKYLLMSEFPIGATITRYNFPTRNRLMAAISDATIIIDASETSGTMHQADECKRLGRPLFIAKHIIDKKGIKWTKKFIQDGSAQVFEDASELFNKLKV